jgi:SAM-dependent methyltransferase
MKLLNFGCGSVFHPDWINIDIESSFPEVLTIDIRKKLLYRDAFFDACYSSHVLEHFTREEARSVLAECYRLLKPKGVIRVVVPDLEGIAREYLETLEKASAGDRAAESDYDWMTLELYDQTVRGVPGGEMRAFLLDPAFSNRDFVRSRIGREADKIWNPSVSRPSLSKKLLSKKPAWFLRKVRFSLAKLLLALVVGKEGQKAFAEGWFRNSGEIHRWMYDRYSLRRLLQESGFVDVKVCRADESGIVDFATYNLDTIDGEIRKPDSLYMEGIKP